jgi:hypothetical protein
MSRTFFFSDLDNTEFVGGNKITIKVSCTTTAYDSDGQHVTKWVSRDLVAGWSANTGCPYWSLRDLKWLVPMGLEGYCGAVLANLYRDDDPANNFYVMLIHVDLNDASPDFDQYYYVDWAMLPHGVIGWERADTYYIEATRPWFIVGPNYKQLPPWTLA